MLGHGPWKPIRLCWGGRGRDRSGMAASRARAALGLLLLPHNLLWSWIAGPDAQHAGFPKPNRAPTWKRAGGTQVRSRACSFARNRRPQGQRDSPAGYKGGLPQNLERQKCGRQLGRHEQSKDGWARYRRSPGWKAPPDA
ncbi:PREDICTED: uncharacterized protein LOC106726296 isoform X3 [Myotis brandtii]|uniref:uncharacterized protein LOC106726296 isoform X3 n=1 Tax=Myotis brandtii TaxID=109478 RepID=UPI0007044136|nr:PREDICTED: uncharacterized protein LOC106726296 isoform X3 [Myotis brandtii]